MKNLDSDLQEAYDQKMMREKIIIHLEGLEPRIQKQTETLALLEIQINKSADDIETLENLAAQPLRKIFNKVLGDQEQQFERKRQNYLLYILRHQEGKKALKANKQLVKLKEDLLTINPWRSSTIPRNASSLSYQQKSYINNLLAEISKVNRALDGFIQELSDVSTHYKLNYDQFVDRISQFLEEFYDGLITDWVLHQEIKITIHLIDDTMVKIKRILFMLENDALHSRQEEEIDRKKLQKLLLDNKI